MENVTVFCKIADVEAKGHQHNKGTDGHAHVTLPITTSSIRRNVYMIHCDAQHCNYTYRGSQERYWTLGDHSFPQPLRALIDKQKDKLSIIQVSQNC